MNEIEEEIHNIQCFLFENGLDADEATTWYKNGFDYEDVKILVSIGVRDPNTALVIEDHGLEPSLLKRKRKMIMDHRQARKSKKT